MSVSRDFHVWEDMMSKTKNTARFPWEDAFPKLFSVKLQ